MTSDTDFASHPGTAQQQLDGAVTDDHAVAVDEVSAWNRNRRSVVRCAAAFGMIVLATSVRAAALTICKPADPKANGHLQWATRSPSTRCAPGLRERAIST